MHRPASKNAPQIETTDAVTGEVFLARTENHYEFNDGVPAAPPVDLPRRTLRERVEDLLYRGGMLPPLQHDESDDGDMDVREYDDPEPLTPSEKQYLVTEGLKTLQERSTEAAYAPQPSPPPIPPTEGQNAPAPTPGRSAAPSTPPPPPPTPGT